MRKIKEINLLLDAGMIEMPLIFQELLLMTCIVMLYKPAIVAEGFKIWRRGSATEMHLSSLKKLEIGTKKFISLFIVSYIKLKTRRGCGDLIDFFVSFFLCRYTILYSKGDNSVST